MDKPMTKERIEHYRRLLKEVSALEERIYDLESLNPKYPLISLSEYDSIRTVGKVIGKITP